MGLARGKNDRVDAMRIAQFTCLHVSGRPSAAFEGCAPALGQPSKAKEPDGLPRSAGQNQNQFEEYHWRSAGDFPSDRQYAHHQAFPEADQARRAADRPDRERDAGHHQAGSAALRALRAGQVGHRHRTDRRFGHTYPHPGLNGLRSDGRPRTGGSWPVTPGWPALNIVRAAA